MRSREGIIDKTVFCMPKDKMGALLEETVGLVLEGLQPLALFRRIGELVNTGLSLIDVFQDLPGIVLEELPVNRVAVMKEVSDNRLEIIAAQDRWEKGPPTEKGWRPQEKIAVRGNGKSPFLRAWKAHKIWVEDYQPDGNGDPQSFVGLPFSIRGEQRGILCFLGPFHKPVESHHLGLWHLLSNQISLVLSAVSFLEGQKLWNHLLEDRVRERTRALQESESKYRALVENMTDIVFTADKEGRFTFISPQAETLTGYPLETFSSMTYRDIVDPKDMSLAERQIAAVSEGKPLEPFEISIRNAVGGRLQIEVSPSPLRDKKGDIVGFQGIARDVTEREKLKRQLQHAQKMEAVGTLAGGMAHEFNNILAAIQGYAQLLSMNVGSDHPMAEYVSNIDTSCQRAAGLTRKILSFSRLEGRNELPMRINRVVSEVKKLLRQTLPPQIDLETELDSNLPFVMADPAQMEQVLLNLGVNARDSMPDGGAIRFETHLIHLDEAFCRKHPWARKGRYVEVMVKDTGQGIAPEIMDRIFDPFFTTKEPGKGTGLGLSIAYSILKNHKGYIMAESQVGRGSCFRICLPVLEEFMEEFPESPREQAHYCGKGESVLVVDDEPQFRDIVKNTLESSGYIVKLAGHGKEAIALYEKAREEGKKFDLVIVDLAMPVMDGKTYLQSLFQIDPNARVLIATGYGEEHLGVDILKLKTKGTLYKPFDLSLLLREVRQSLDG
jgi:two-component system cell cycle sensor histidine kinase/response regulator CckA